MPEIKNTTGAEALEQALKRLDEARRGAERELADAHKQAVADLQLREAAVADLSGLIERAKHAYVKDFKPYHPVPLANVRLGGPGGLDVVFVEGRGTDYDQAQNLARRPYRFWLLIEELPLPEVPDAR